MIRALALLVLAALPAAIGAFWAYTNPYSPVLFSALLACAAACYVFGAMATGALMFEVEQAIKRAIFWHKHRYPLARGYVLVDDPQPTL